MKSWISPSGPALKAHELRHFFRQLALLIAAGVNLMQSLRILTQSVSPHSLRTLLKALQLELESGKAFHLCLKKYPQYFDPFCCHLIYLGECTGTLELSLKRIAQHQEKAAALKQAFKQALFYPLLILIAALGFILVLLLFVVPHFANLFSALSTELPPLTKALIYFSELMQQASFWLLFLLSLICFALLHRKLRQSFRQLYEDSLFKIGCLRTFILKILLIQLTRNLAVSLASGLPLSEALKLITHFSSFKTFNYSLLTIQQEIQAGQRLSQALAAHPFFPPLLLQMLRTGEEAGKLEAMLEKFAELSEAELEQFLAAARQGLEPLIIAILGVLIGVVVVAMYLPIFRLGTTL